MRVSDFFTISPGCKDKRCVIYKPDCGTIPTKIKQVQIFSTNPIPLSYVQGLHPKFQSEPSDGLLKTYIFQNIFSKVPQLVVLLERTVQNVNILTNQKAKVVSQRYSTHKKKYIVPAKTKWNVFYMYICGFSEVVCLDAVICRNSGSTREFYRHRLAQASRHHLYWRLDGA